MLKILLLTTHPLDLQENPANMCINLILWATFLPLILYVYARNMHLIVIFVVDSEKHMYDATELIMAVQDHPRSLILVSIKNTSYAVCNFVLPINSNHDPILHHLGDKSQPKGLTLPFFPTSTLI